MVLVTGAAGFIGSNLARTLVGRGEKVRVIVRQGSNRDRLPEGVEIFPGDVRDAGPLPRALEGVGTVYHLASRLRRMRVPDSEYWETNVRGTENMLRASEDAGVERFVHSSSTSVTGPVKGAPADETAPYAPRNIYEVTKCEGEKRALEFSKRDRMTVTVVRPAWTYGPGDTRTVAFFRAIKRRRMLVVGDGRTLVHPAFVDNVVEGMIQAAHARVSNGQIYILADRMPVTVEQLARRVAQHLGVEFPGFHAPVWAARVLALGCEWLWGLVGREPPVHRGRVEFFRRQAAYDISKAVREIGYNPAVDLDTGLERTIAWYKEHGLL